MTTAAADRTSRHAVSRAGARKAPAGSKGVRRPASSTVPLSAIDPVKAATVDDVMAVLAAFGLEG